jgi:hypothetical protein
LFYRELYTAPRKKPIDTARMKYIDKLLGANKYPKHINTINIDDMKNLYLRMKFNIVCNRLRD